MVAVAISGVLMGSGLAQYQIIIVGMKFVTCSDDTDSQGSRQLTGSSFCLMTSAECWRRGSERSAGRVF